MVDRRENSILVRGAELLEYIRAGKFSLRDNTLCYGRFKAANLSDRQVAQLATFVSFARARSDDLVIPKLILFDRIGARASRGRDLWRKTANYAVWEWVIVAVDGGYGLLSLDDPRWQTYREPDERA